MVDTLAFAADKVATVKDTFVVQVSKVADMVAVVYIVVVVVATVVVKAVVAAGIVVQVKAVVVVVAIVVSVDNMSEVVDSLAAAESVDIAEMDLVIVALYSPLQHNIMHSKFNLYIYYNAGNSCQ